jgi:hypothetical protein
MARAQQLAHPKIGSGSIHVRYLCQVHYLFGWGNAWFGLFSRWVGSKAKVEVDFQG